MCGIESLEEAVRALPPVTDETSFAPAQIMQALETLSPRQELNRQTRAVHAAAFWRPDAGLVALREDVGRHNALDKLIGALARTAIDPAAGFILLSARCSYELVEKAVRAGCPMLVTISAPTSLAVERAVEAGLTLVTLARTDSALIVNDAQRMIE